MRRVQLWNRANGANNGEETSGGGVWGEQEHYILGVEQSGHKGRSHGSFGQESFRVIQGRDDSSSKDCHSVHLQESSPSTHHEGGGSASH